MPKVVFICVENSNRSQMAEAFLRMHGGDRFEAHSAGSRPSGAVNPRAVNAMAELGYDLSAHRSNAVDDLPEGPWDWAITMGCGDECPWLPAENRADWPLSDPRDMPPEEFNVVRDEIQKRVLELIARYPDESGS